MTNRPTLKTWIMAFRPKTLPAGIAPVFLGTALAFGDGAAHFPTAVVCLLTAVSIQIATNLANDYFDYRHGADTEERVGPIRVTQAGLIPPYSVKYGAILFFGVAALTSFALVLRAGWPIGILAVLSILSGLFYTAGPRPLGYLGLGELFVLFFFGPVAVGGTYYVQSFEINLGIILAGLAAGCLSSAILVVNNLRDYETDRKSAKKTLAVRFGKTFARYEYYLFIVAACLIPVLLYGIIRDHIAILWSTLTLIFAAKPIHTVFTREGPILNKILAQTSVLLLIFTLLFAIGWIL